MIREICKDVLFLARKAEPATPGDLPVAADLLETLLAHKDGFGAVTCQNGRLSYEPALGSLEILHTQLI